MEWCPPLHQGVLAIEKGAIRSPLIKVANFTNLVYPTFLDWILSNCSNK